MRRFLLLPMVLIVTMPLFADNSPRVPTGATVYAGHTLYGGWCDCGAPGCICDPGEVLPGGGAPQQIPDEPPAKHGQTTDPMPVGLLIGVALLLLFRLRFN